MHHTILGAAIAMFASTAALAKPVHLSCPTSDPDWAPALQIMVDGDRGAVSVSSRMNSGQSPNAEFTQDSVQFGFAGSRFYLSRVNLTLITTSDYVHKYRTVCRLGAPVKRAF